MNELLKRPEKRTADPINELVQFKCHTAEAAFSIIFGTPVTIQLCFTQKCAEGDVSLNVGGRAFFPREDK